MTKTPSTPSKCGREGRWVFRPCLCDFATLVRPGARLGCIAQDCSDLGACSQKARRCCATDPACNTHHCVHIAFSVWEFIGGDFPPRVFVNKVYFGHFINDLNHDMSFDLSGIAVLAQVVESGSFVRAAEALELSSSGVSRAISRLEARMGVRLFERTTRSLNLTDEGQRLYDQVRPHLTGVSEAVALASGAAHAVRGKLRVNIDAFFARVFLASRLTEFLNRYPDLSVELLTQESLGDLVADRFDLAVRFVDPPAGSSLVARRLATTRILTVASPAVYRQATAGPSTLGRSRSTNASCFETPSPLSRLNGNSNAGGRRWRFLWPAACWFLKQARCWMRVLRGPGLRRYSSWGRRSWCARKSSSTCFPIGRESVGRSMPCIPRDATTRKAEGFPRLSVRPPFSPSLRHESCRLTPDAQRKR